MGSSTVDTGLPALHRQGTLAARYPEVRGLLAGASGDELARAGRLLATLDPADVLREHPDTPVVTVAVTGHGTVGPLVPALTAELARHGLLLRATVRPFDSWVFDLSDPGAGLCADDPDLVLCLLDPAVVLDELPVPWDVSDVEGVLTAKMGLVTSLAERFDGRALVLNTLPLPRRATAQLVDQRSRARLGARWREANAALLGLVERLATVSVVDLDPLLADGIPAVDERLDAYARAHLSPALLAGYAREVGHLARQLTGRAAKVLALDLDGTLWGGVLGDDGIDGIEVADTPRGEAFSGFQRVVKQLGAQGVLLAVVSKNDPELVRRALRERAGLTLREDDFVRVAAGWEPKPDALRQLAAALNLDVDSFVFVDDSPFECGLVGRELPAVPVVRLDGEPARHAGTLLRDGWFDVREVTAEDRARGGRYRAEAARQDFQGAFTSLDDYLRELGVQVRFGPVRPGEVARVAQLTQRTNQFNLTTRRLSAAEVTGLAGGAGSDVLAIHARDRFGDNGLVGAVFTRLDGGALHIDNFVLSCRVFSRGIEQACLTQVLRQARTGGRDGVVGSYRPTPRNGLVSDFYPRHGFAAVGTDGGAATYRHDLTDVPPLPRHIRMVDDDGGDW